MVKIAPSHRSQFSKLEPGAAILMQTGSKLNWTKVNEYKSIFKLNIFKNWKWEVLFSQK